jgi:thiol-disulfide isomerase/thioredoxin
MTRRMTFLVFQLLAVVIGSVAAPAGYSVLVRSFVSGSWQNIRGQHAGKPLIVHFWGLTCAPCRLEMPHWGELLAAESRLPLVTVHADRAPDEATPLIAEMLAGAGLDRAESWRFADAPAERLRHEIDPLWQGELPLTLLVASDGTVTRIAGSADMAVVRSWFASKRE